MADKHVARLANLLGALADRLLDAETRLATAERSLGIDPAAAIASAKASRETAEPKPAKRIGRRTSK